MENSIKRKLHYKNLLERGNELRTNTNCLSDVNTINEVSHIINESNLLNGQASASDHANNTTEVVMDAQVMKMGHELLGTVIDKIGCSEFSDGEYFTALISKVFTGNAANWDVLAEIGISVSKPTKFKPCLLGSFMHDPVIIDKPVKEKRKKRATQSQLLRPEEVSKLQKDDKVAHKLNIVLDQILKIFRQTNEQAIPYYKLIIDPASVMKTIDNSFQVAFLISNGSIALETDTKGLPAVRPVMKDKSNRSTVIQVQSACNITSEIFQKMIKVYKIQEPLLK